MNFLYISFPSFWIPLHENFIFSSEISGAQYIFEHDDIILSLYIAKQRQLKKDVGKIRIRNLLQSLTDAISY